MCLSVGPLVGPSVCHAFAFWPSSSDVCRVYGLVFLYTTDRRTYEQGYHTSIVHRDEANFARTASSGLRASHCTIYRKRNLVLRSEDEAGWRGGKNAAKVI